MKVWLPLVTLLAISLAACSKKEPTGPQPLVIGMELTYPPFEMTDKNGKPDGISIHLAEAIGQHLGRPIEIKDIAWDGIIASLHTGKIDIILSSLSITAERRKAIDYSEPYVTNGLCALVAKDSPLQKPEDFQRPGLSIAVKAETTGEKYCEEALPSAQRIRLDEASDCVMQVMQGKVDAFIYDQVSIYKSWMAHKEATRPILQPFRQESWAIGLRKGEEELKGQINAALKKFREAKGFETLADRYMAEERKAFAELGVPFIFH